MHGRDINKLEVYVDGGSRVTILIIEGNQGDIWKERKEDIKLQSMDTKVS